MKNNGFYHDKINGVQKIKGYPVIAERDNISTTNDFDEQYQIVAYNGELYVYLPDSLTYKKILLDS